MIGIYVSFLAWALLQERISAQGYGPNNEIFRGALVINSVQSFLAMTFGFIYMKYKGSGTKFFKGNTGLLKDLTLVAVSQSMGSPFGYAALGYVNYLTFLLAKSCKLVPIMFIHLTVYHRKFPLYKYAVVLAITSGVFMFTYYKQTNPSKGVDNSMSSWIGLGLLGISLLLDGVTNSTQDQIFQKYTQMTGPHMMFGLNRVAVTLTSCYLIVSGLVLTFFSQFSSTALPPIVSYTLSFLFNSQLSNTLSFVSRNGFRVLLDIALFGLCGAIGQVFLFHTLENYGSLILVMVTVTRKMMSMLLSVAWFGHKLSRGQWIGVAAVFGGIGAEAAYKYKQQMGKKTKKTK